MVTWRHWNVWHFWMTKLMVMAVTMVMKDAKSADSLCRSVRSGSTRWADTLSLLPANSTPSPPMHCNATQFCAMQCNAHQQCNRLQRKTTVLQICSPIMQHCVAMQAIRMQTLPAELAQPMQNLELQQYMQIKTMKSKAMECNAMLSTKHKQICSTQQCRVIENSANALWKWLVTIDRNGK